jgi:hypothetical protein
VLLLFMQYFMYIYDMLFPWTCMPHDMHINYPTSCAISRVRLRNRSSIYAKTCTCLRNNFCTFMARFPWPCMPHDMHGNYPISFAIFSRLSVTIEPVFTLNHELVYADSANVLRFYLTRLENQHLGCMYICTHNIYI